MTCRRLAVRFLTAVLVLVFSVTPSRSVGDTYSYYRDDQQIWIVGNSLIQAAFQLNTNGQFRYRWLQDTVNRHLWRSSAFNPSSPFNLTVDGVTLDQSAVYTLVSYSLQDITSPASGSRVSIVLSTEAVSGQIQFDVDVYQGQPFVRYRTQYTNTGSVRSYVTQADMLPWRFQDNRETYR